MLDADSVPRQAYERLLAEYRALVAAVQMPCLTAERFRHARAVIAMAQRELEDADYRGKARGMPGG